MWDAVMAENRIIKLGKRADFQCRRMEYQLGAYTGCSHGAGLAVPHPVYYRHIYKEGLAKFKRFAVNVWGIDPAGKSDEETVLAGIKALGSFIKEIGLPANLWELGVGKDADLKAIADSCAIAPGSYKRMTREEIFEIFNECR